MAVTAAFADQALNFMLRGQGGGSPPSAWYVALLTSDPELNGMAGEVTGSGYVRKAVTFTAPAGTGLFSNTALIDWGNTPADWGEIGFYAVVSAVSGGTAYFYGTLDTPVIAGTGTPVNVPANRLVVGM